LNQSLTIRGIARCATSRHQRRTTVLALDQPKSAISASCRKAWSNKNYHGSHGYFCLPDILWKSRLGPFIEQNPTLGPLLRKASVTRRAKKANECFVTIATTILSMEILASSFGGWSSLYPEAANNARAFLRRNSVNAQTLLMDYYVYRSKHSNIFAKLSPPSP